MIGGKAVVPLKQSPVMVKESRWVRSPVGGVFRAVRNNGDHVNKGDLLGYVSDPFGDADDDVLSQDDGIIIGRTNLPFTNPGDALFHIAKVKRPEAAGEKLEKIERVVESDPLFDEDEII